MTTRPGADAGALPADLAERVEAVMEKMRAWGDADWAFHVEPYNVDHPSGESLQLSKRRAIFANEVRAAVESLARDLAAERAAHAATREAARARIVAVLRDVGKSWFKQAALLDDDEKLICAVGRNQAACERLAALLADAPAAGETTKASES